MSKRQVRAASRRSSKRLTIAAGFRIFFVCVILAGILGSAVRLYFAPPRLKDFLEAQISKQNLPYKVELTAAQLTLARGILPAFAIDITGVEVSHFAPCPTEPFVRAEMLALPIDWWALLTGRIKIGVIRANEVNISTDRAKCDRFKSHATNQIEIIDNDGSIASFTTREPNEAKSWFTADELERVKSIISGIKVRNGAVYFDQSKRFMQIDEFSAWHKGDSIAVGGKIKLPAETTYGEVFPTIDLYGQLTSSLLQLDLKSSFDEGELGATLQLTPTDDPKSPYAKVLFQAGAMPLSIFSNFLQKLGVLQGFYLQPRFMWLNCEVRSEGPLGRLLKHTELHVHACVVEGDAGRLEIPSAVRAENGVWQPFKIEIQSLAIKDVLEMLGLKGPSGVLSSFGVLKGAINYESKHQQAFEGSLEDLEIYFSNHNVRATQKVFSINMVASRAEGKISGQLGNIQLNPGNVRGEVRFSFDDRLKNGELNFETRELSLDPKVQKLMADGTFEKLSLEGNLKVVDGKIDNWNGLLQAELYSGTQLKVVKPVVETKFNQQRFNIVAKASTGELSSTSKWLGWVKKAAPNLKLEDKGDEWLPISGIKMQMTVSPDTVSWKNASLTTVTAKTQLQSSGELSQDRQVTGVLSTQESNGKFKKFIISGSVNNPKLTQRN